VPRLSSSVPIEAPAAPTLLRREMPWRRVAFGVAVGFPFAFLLAFVAYPMFQQGWGSFASWFQLKPSGFAGLVNYRQVFNDIIVRVSTLHSVFYDLLTVPAEVGLGLAAAWMTLHVKRGQGLLAVVFLIPLAVPASVATNLFDLILNFNGVAIHAMRDIVGGGSSFVWLYHPRLAFGVIVAYGIWTGFPWCFLLLLGALSGCSEELFEAARVDGASGLTFWWRVVIPSIRSMFVLVVVLRIALETQAYTAVAALTNGGPSFPGGTDLVGFYDYKLAFGYYNFGAASAMGTLVGVFLVIVAVGGFILAYPGRLRFRRSSGTLGGYREPFPGTGWLSGLWERFRRPRQVAATPGRHRLGLRASLRWGSRARWALLVLVAAFVLIPFAGTEHFWYHGRYEFYGTNWSLIWTGTLNSLLLCALALAGTLVLSVPAAYFLAFKQSRWRPVLFGFVLFALVVPGVIFIYPQFEEIVWMKLVNTRLGILVLYVTAELPLTIFFLRPAFASVPKALVEAMRVDGASNFTILRRLILRHAASTIVAMSVLIVVFVWGEVPIAQAVLNTTNQSAYTLPLLLAQGPVGTSLPFNPIAAYLISLGAPLVLFIVTQRYFRRGLVSGTLVLQGAGAAVQAARYRYQPARLQPAPLHTGSSRRSRSRFLGRRHKPRTVLTLSATLAKKRRRKSFAAAIAAAMALFGLGTGLGHALSGTEPLPGGAEHNLVGQTPAMGWSTWSFEREATTAAGVEAQAKALVSTGLKAVGYRYVLVDDGWYYCTGSQGPAVDANGRWATNTTSFPDHGSTNGMEVVANYVHKLGLKFGIYVTPGISGWAVSENVPILNADGVGDSGYTAKEIADTSFKETNYNCAYQNGGMVGLNYSSPGAQDFIDSWADEFASWGVDFVKIDGVGSRDIDDVEAWSKALEQTGHPIYLFLSNNLPIADASTWANYANAWRTGNDIECYTCEQDNSSYPLTRWSNVQARFDQVAQWAPDGGPGAYNDYDSIEVGNGPADDGITGPEAQSMLSLWSLGASPLILGADLTHLTKADLGYLKNTAVIAVDQDGIDATRIVNKGNDQVFAKTEHNGDVVVGLFNYSGSAAQTGTVTLSGAGTKGSYDCTDLWGGPNPGTISGTYSVVLGPGAVKLLRCAPASAGATSNAQR